MPFLIGTLAALVVGVATLGSATAAIVAGVFATIVSYMVLPVLAPDFADLWLLAIATLALGGAAAWCARRRQGRGSRPVRAAMLTMAAALSLLTALGLASFVSTASLFRAGAYAALIGTVETVPFAQAIQRLDNHRPRRRLRPDGHRPGDGAPGRCRRGRTARTGAARPGSRVRRHLRARHHAADPARGAADVRRPARVHRPVPLAVERRRAGLRVGGRARRPPSTAGNPNGTTGFLLVDSRSKRASYFEQSGATETGRRDAILGKVAEKRGWSAGVRMAAPSRPSRRSSWTGWWRGWRPRRSTATPSAGSASRNQAPCSAPATAWVRKWRSPGPATGCTSRPRARQVAR